MAKATSKTFRLTDFGGGLNTLDDSTDIDDKQATVCSNFTFEGNKLVTLNGFVLAKQFSATVSPIQGMKLYGNILVVLHNGTLYTYDISTGATQSLGSACTVGKDYYVTVFLNKIVICNFLEAPKAFTYDPSSASPPVSQAFTGLDADFTATSAEFYDGRLFLAQYNANTANTVINNIMLFSKSISTNADLSPAFDFSALDSSSQVIGDGAPITGFLIGRDNFYVFKSNSVYKLGQVAITRDSSDVITGVAYPNSQVSNTGAVNQGCVENVDQDIFFFDGKSVRRLSYEENVLALKDASISDDIKPTIEGLPDNQTEAKVFFIYPLVKVFVRSDLSADNDIALVYNVINKSWSIQETIILKHATSGFDQTTSKRVAFFGSVFDGSVYKDNIGNTSADGSRAGQWISKEFDFGDSVDFKRLTELEVVGLVSPEFSFVISILDTDGNVIDTRTETGGEIISPTLGSSVMGATTIGGAGSSSASSRGTIFRLRMEEFADSRTFRVQIDYDGTGYGELHALNFMYRFVKAYPIHY